MAKASRFADLPGVKLLQRRIRTQMELEGRIPFFRPHLGVSGALIDIGSGPLINFSGYNYLGLSGHPEVSAAAKAAIDQYGTSASASRIVSGEIPLHRELEQALARFVGAEDALVFVGGYNTNVTTIGHLYGRKDLILYDEQSHNSLMSGVTLSGAHRRSFLHNDWADLRAQLAAHRAAHGRVLIVAEGLYSMHGDVADLATLIALRDEFNADLMLDEAHSLGTLGATGRGMLEVAGVAEHAIDIHMGTLSKSFAGCGGFIAGDATLIQYLRFSAPGFLFSVGMPPADAAAALAALRVLEREPERAQRLQENGRAFRRIARECGFTVEDGDTPIVPIVVGDDYQCMDASFRLLSRGFNVQPVIFPAVPKNGALLRYFICADHTEAQLQSTLQATAEVLREMRLR